ncbi:MAG TPA: GAF domain-containing protein [Syntrophorhabdaceae bacterium]|jgi:transcriptional regulator with GAF, ATPase, and Fis domain
MIERKSFLRMMRTIILSLRKGLTDPTVNAKQDIIEELSSIMGVERCVVFGIGQEQIDGQTHISCEIVAGVPLNEYEWKLHQKLSLSSHPDIEDAVGTGLVMIISDPRNDPRTQYFKEIIKESDISEIAYLPLRYEDDEQWTEIIVLDAVHEKRFDEDEIQFCLEVAEFLNIILGRETLLLQHFRDAIINRMVPLEGFAVKLRDNLQATLSYVSIIYREAEEISSLLPRKLNRRL